MLVFWLLVQGCSKPCIRHTRKIESSKTGLTLSGKAASVKQFVIFDYRENAPWIARSASCCVC